MAPAGNWISFTLPQSEMLVRPCAQYEAHPASYPLLAPTYAPHGDAASYQYYFFPQAPKLEDLLGNYQPLMLEPCAEAQESSSLSTAHPPPLPPPPAAGALHANSASSEVVDSASATANEKQCANSGGLCSHTPEPGTEFALSAVPLPLASAAQPRAVDKVAASAVSAASQRTSVYRGVTRHRWTGRYEAHLWDNTCRREGQKRKGRQVYLGGYDKEEKAARAYDLAALKYWGLSATTNFPVESYSKEIEEMKDMNRQEFIASLRRKSSGFSRGASVYRGVTKHHQHGRWQARIGRVAGNKDLYLGTFATEEEAAEAYDVAAIKFRGANAVTNFELGRYDVEAIANNELPIGGGSAKRLKHSLQTNSSSQLTGNASPAISTHPNSDTSCLIHHLLQLPSHACSSGPFAYSDFGETTADLCSQSLYWLSANHQHSNQIYNNRLTHVAPE